MRNISMAESMQIPHLLSAYLQLPAEHSLILLTNVLNATTNWLLLRYLLAAGKSAASGDSFETSRPNIVFVSLLRDFSFWRDNARRINLDLNQAIQTGRLTYIDGLSFLFRGNKSATRTGDSIGASNSSTLTDSSISGIEAQVSQALATATRKHGTETKPLLIIDGLDFVLASTAVSASELLSTVMAWRELAYSTILTLSADQSLAHTQQTSLEIEHLRLLTSLTHQAQFVMSLRLLSTGAARDVSGVLRTTRGGGAHDIEADQQSIEEKEVLYLVGGDSGVKVFERGAG